MRMTGLPSSRSPAQRSSIDEVKELRELALNRRAASFNSFRQRLQKAQAAAKQRKEAQSQLPKPLLPLIAE